MFNVFKLMIFHCLLSILRQVYFLDYKCNEGRTKCSDGKQCIYTYQLCNRYEDCNDKSDEDDTTCRGNYILLNLQLGIQKRIYSFLSM